MNYESSRIPWDELTSLAKSAATTTRAEPVESWGYERTKNVTQRKSVRSKGFWGIGRKTTYVTESVTMPEWVEIVGKHWIIDSREEHRVETLAPWGGETGTCTEEAGHTYVRYVLLPDGSLWTATKTVGELIRVLMANDVYSVEHRIEPMSDSDVKLLDHAKVSTEVNVSSTKTVSGNMDSLSPIIQSSKGGFLRDALTAMIP